MSEDGIFDALSDDPLAHFKTRAASVSSACKKDWDSAEENENFCRAGAEPDHQWPADDWEHRKTNKLPLLQINDTILAVNAISGRQIVGASAPTYLGQDESSQDQGAATVLRQFDRKVRERGDFADVDSDRFRTLNIQNYAWGEWWQDLSKNPLGIGQTRLRGVPIYEMLWDRRSPEKNLRSRIWDARGRWVGYEEAMGMFPLEEEREELKELAKAGESAWVDSEFKGGWPTIDEEGDAPWNWKQARSVFLVDYQWRTQEAHYVVDLSSPVVAPGQTPEPSRYVEIETAEELQEESKLYKRAYGQELPWAPIPRWKYHYAFIVGSKVVRSELLPVQEFSRQAMTSFPWNKRGDVTHYGTVELMKDGQRFRNMVFAMALSMFQHSAKRNLLLEEMALTNPEQADNWTKIGGVVRFREGRLKDGWAESSGPVWPPAFEQMLQHATEAVWRPIGLTPAAIGQIQDPRRVSGNVFDQMQEAVEVVLSYPFGSLRLWHKDSARMMLAYMNAYYDEETVARMVGGVPFDYAQENPEEVEQERLLVVPPRAAWEEIQLHDILTDEASREKSQMHETFRMWVDQGLAEKLIGGGLMPADLLPDMAPGMPEQMRSYWKSWLRQRMAAMESGEETQE